MAIAADETELRML